MKRAAMLATGTCLLMLMAMPAVSAHERYFTSDDEYLIILGEQNEPVYTYDFTNLDFFVRNNATGDPIVGVEQTVTATLIAPNGEELSMPLEEQFGSPGEYEFEEDYILTLPGQYKVRLEGSINGTDVTGEYLLPGPRKSSTDIHFPHDDVQDLRKLQERMDAMEAHMDQMMMDGGDDSEDGGGAPGLTILPALAVVGAAALLRVRREG